MRLPGANQAWIYARPLSLWPANQAQPAKPTQLSIISGNDWSIWAQSILVIILLPSPTLVLHWKTWHGNANSCVSSRHQLTWADGIQLLQLLGWFPRH